MKQLSDKEKKRRKLEKELKSFRKKLNESNLIWFDALNNQRKYDLLIEWKREKWNKRNIKFPKKSKKFLHTTRKVKIISIYPASLKYFLISSKMKMRYKPSRRSFRESFLNSILGE
jgi:hypothetical protein